MTKRMIRSLALVLLLALVWAGCGLAAEFQVGQTVELAQREGGIPAREQEGKSAATVYIPSGSRVTVDKLGQKQNWVRVPWNNKKLWIVTRYIARIVTTETDAPAYVVGCWNLEHFHDGKTRGFPENTDGGPTIPKRSDAQHGMIASAITQRVKASLLVLSEINGKMGTDEDGDPVPVSDELDKLLTKLPGGWRYVISHAGGSEREHVPPASGAVLPHDGLAKQHLGRARG